MYAGQEATVRTGYETTDWFQIRKGVHQGCILSPCLFNIDHLLPVPSRPDGTLQRRDREHWALLETSPASGLSLQSSRTTTVAAPRGNTYTTYQFISIRDSASCVAIWIHHQLRVAVQVDEAFEVPMICNEICHRFHLHF